MKPKLCSYDVLKNEYFELDDPTKTIRMNVPNVGGYIEVTVSKHHPGCLTIRGYSNLVSAGAFVIIPEHSNVVHVGFGGNIE